MDLNFSTGVKEYNINGRYTVRFNPTDIKFIDRVFTAFDELDKRHEEYRARISEETNNAEVFSIAREIEKVTRSTIDSVFGDGASNAIFEDVSVLAGDGDGLPLWAVFLLTIIDVMDEAFTAEKKATNPRLQKYIKKYQR